MYICTYVCGVLLGYFVFKARSKFASSGEQQVEVHT